MSAHLTLDGFEAAVKALEEFPTKFANKAVKKSLKAAMQEVTLREVLRTVAVDDGTLKRTLKVRTAKGPGNKRLKRGVIGFQVESTKTKTRDAYYAGWNFLGAKNRDGTKRVGTRTLRNALYGTANVLHANFAGKLRVEVPRVAREVRIDSLRYKG